MRQATHADVSHCVGQARRELLFAAEYAGAAGVSEVERELIAEVGRLVEVLEHSLLRDARTVHNRRALAARALEEEARP